jgi:hypothetical protein
MRGKIFSIVVFLFLCGFAAGQGLDQLAVRTAGGIHEFISRENFVRTSIVAFENHSGLSDQIAQRFYQLLVSRLESDHQIRFSDLMINFNQNRGVFNLNDVSGFDYLLYLRLIRNREKLGAGLVAFSKTLDKIVYVQYKEVLIPSGEERIFSIREYGFKSLGFARAFEIETSPGLLDVRSVLVPAGETITFFYYPDRIDIFRQGANLLEKISSIRLDWGRPYYPVLEHEGRLAVFRIGDTLYLSAGGNFSPYSRVFRLQNNRWESFSRLEFIPFRLIQVNQQFYLAGSRYELGRNYFVSKIYLVSLENGDFRKGKLFEKSVPEFYCLDFASTEGGLMSVHMVDRKYRYRFFASDFEEKTVEESRRGSSLMALDGKWLAVSDYSRGSDTLFFYRIDEGSRQPVYRNKIQGEIIFVSAGVWKTERGFWLMVRRTEKGRPGFFLEFWRKSEKNPGDDVSEGENQ